MTKVHAVIFFFLLLCSFCNFFYVLGMSFVCCQIPVVERMVRDRVLGRRCVGGVVAEGAVGLRLGAKAHQEMRQLANHKAAQ